MINRFHKNKIPILSCLDSMKYKHDLSTKDWLVMEQSVKVLQTFDHVTKVISAEKSVTISKMGIFLNILRQKIEKEMSDELEPPVKKLMSMLIQGLLEKGKPYLENKLVNQAMLLDPRMKNHSFENDRDRYEETYQSLIDAMVPFKANNSSAEEPITQQAFTDPSYECLFSDFTSKIKRVRHNINPETAAKLELDEYLKMECIEFTADPLSWWKSYKGQFPAVYQIMLKLYCILATSVPCERIFSKAGNIYSDKRSKLLPKKMSQILFLQQNYQHEP